MLNDRPLHFRPVHYVIMDLDGTIIDTEEHMENVYKEYLKPFNVPFTEEMKLKFMGRTPKDTYQMLKNDYKVDHKLEEYIKKKDALQEKYLKNVKLMPGVEQTINWFYENDVPMAIATSSSRKEYERRVVNYQQLFSKFHHITTRNDYDRGKPFPDAYIICAAKFVHPAEANKVLVFEDSLSGVEAARAAGMQVILVGDAKYEEKDKRRATRTIHTFCDFDPKEFNLG